MARAQFSVDEAAKRLGVSPRRVRELVKSGRLPAERIGAGYVVGAEDLALYQQLHRPGGRPLRARNAWALLAQLSGHPEAIPTSPRSSYRLRHFLERPEDVRNLLAHSEPRSDLYRWRVLPNDLSKLAASDLVPTGLAAQDPRIGVLYDAERDGLDAYVSQQALSLLEQRFRPERESRAPNVILRVPRGSDWILGRERAPTAVVAADLLEDRDPRVRRAARSALEKTTNLD